MPYPIETMRMTNSQIPLMTVIAMMGLGFGFHCMTITQKVCIAIA